MQNDEKKFSSYIWCSDYEVCIDEAYLVHSKWMRIINKSAAPVVIYCIEINHPRCVKMEASSCINGEEFDFYGFDNSCAKISYDNEVSINHEPKILSDARFPLCLKPYDVFEGYVFFRGFSDDLLNDTDIIIKAKTSRGNKEIHARIDFFEGDV